MPFIGNKPTAVPLTSADLADSIITSAKIADGTIVNTDINASAGIVTSKLSGALGITVADQFRLTTSYTGNADPIASNLERIDNATRGNGTLGTGMTESSGIFTFPSTGIWLIKFYRNGFLNGDSRSFDAYIQTTVNNSSYDVATQGVTFVQQTNSNTTGVMSVCEVLFDVTDVTTHKCRFRTDDFATTTTVGNTDVNKTYMTFIRLGDT